MNQVNTFWDLMKEVIGFTVSMFIFAGWFCLVMWVMMDIVRNLVQFCR